MRSYVALAVFGGLLLSSACAQDIPDIDRTQPRAVRKSIFRMNNEDGSLRRWYFLSTVTDVPFGSAATFVGEQTEAELIHWDITEKFLYAYRAYEHVKGSEQGQQRENTGGYRGAAVAAYPIESHFDINRAFNPATGEQSNVIVENTSDRPWYQREYMRIDFSKNHITDFRFVTSLVQQQAVGYYIPETETDNKDRAQITEGYIDIVNKVYIQPEIDPDIYYEYGVPFPVCWLYTGITNDCLGQTIKIRSSFMLAEKRPYKPQSYDNHQMDKFGYFRVTRYAYDRDYGITEQGVENYINRWDIWKDSGTCVDLKQEKTHTKCQIRQIAMHVNDQYPENLKAAGARVLGQWNDVFRELVEQLSGRDQGAIFIFCPNNPVREGDPEICGKPGTAPQIGDIRYTFLYWVNEPHRASPFGYGPAAVDPLTGEIISSSSFVYGAEIDTYATYATDLVRILTGDLKADDVIEAKHISTYFKNLNKIKASSSKTWSGPIGKRFGRNPRLEKKKVVYQKRVRKGMAQRDWVAANLRRFQHVSGVEDILRGEFFRAFGLHHISPSGQITEEIRKRYGFHKIANRNFYLYSKHRRQRLAKHNIMMPDFFDDAIVASALRLQKEYTDSTGKTDYTAIRKRLREEIFVATAIHEIGHNLGLRHNFAASADALNYFDQYWKLRAQTIPTGATAPLPEYRYDSNSKPLLDKAVQQGMREYQSSSIMDYHASFACELHGIGKYDKAAIMYGYGHLVQVFRPGTTAIKPSEAPAKLAFGEWHYTQLPGLISGADKPFADQLVPVLDSGRKWISEEQLKRQTDLIEVPYRFCTDEYHAGTADCYVFDKGADYYERVRHFSEKYWNYYIFDAFKRGRVLFGDDIYSYLGHVYDRYFAPIADQYKHFLNDWWFVEYGSSCGGEDWYNEPQCGESGMVAAVAALNFFARVIQIPDTGCYRRPLRPSSPQQPYKLVSNTECQPGQRGGYNYINIPLGIGRRMITQFDYQKYGHEFAWKPVSIGTWWDKYLAVLALGDPYTSFYGIDTEANLAGYLINFNTLFARYVNNIVGSFIIEQPQFYGPVLHNDQIAFRDPIQLSGNSDLFNANPRYTGVPVDPNEQYSAQYMAGVIGAIYFSFDLNDQFFNESMKISVRGLSDSPDVPQDIRSDAAKYIEIVDPGSYRIYYAVKVDNISGPFEDEPPFFAVGYEYLKRIKDKYFLDDGRTLKPNVERWEVEGEFQFINIMIGWVREGEYNKNPEP
jgi:hypothetical protein